MLGGLNIGLQGPSHPTVPKAYVSKGHERCMYGRLAAPVGAYNPVRVLRALLPRLTHDLRLAGQ